MRCGLMTGVECDVLITDSLAARKSTLLDSMTPT
jgi:hypothetical protein